MQKEIIVLGGPNGSGKSTLADFLIAETGFLFLNADEIEKELKIQQFEGNTHLQAGRILFERLEAARKNGVSFILESTLSGKTLLSILRDLLADGYKLRVVYIFLESPELCIARIKGRVQKGGHHVSDEDVRRRYYRSIKNFWAHYRVLANEWVIYLNAENRPVLVATGETAQTTAVLETLYFNQFNQLLDDK